jgi:hypothetical protein
MRPIECSTRPPAPRLASSVAVIDRSVRTLASDLVLGAQVDAADQVGAVLALGQEGGRHAGRAARRQARRRRLPRARECVKASAWTETNRSAPDCARNVASLEQRNEVVARCVPSWRGSPAVALIFFCEFPGDRQHDVLLADATRDRWRRDPAPPCPGVDRDQDAAAPVAAVSAAAHARPGLAPIAVRAHRGRAGG